MARQAWPVSGISGYAGFTTYLEPMPNRADYPENELINPETNNAQGEEHNGVDDISTVSASEHNSVRKKSVLPTE